jgi:peptidyl-prolyl cis-trans isomerase C
MSIGVRNTLMIASVLACAAAVAAQAPPEADSVVLTVNGEPVSGADVRLAMQNVAVEMQRRGQQVERETLVENATRQVVDTKLLAQEAVKRDITLPEGQVESIMARVEEQSGGREALEAALSGAGVSYQDLVRTVRESELALSLIDTAIRPTVTVTDEELQQFYADNPQMFQRPEQVHARHILFEVGEDATSEDQAAAKERADEAHRRAAAGEDFAELAKELSEGPSAQDGGDLGFFSAERMIPSFAEAAFALEPGEISQPVRTRFGYHVIKVEERREASTQALDEVRDPLRNALLERKVSAQVAEMLEGLRAAAEIVPSTASAQGPSGSGDVG